MHHHLLQISLIIYGAFSVFCSYLPAPGAPKSPDTWWYPPVFHTLQYLSFNPGRSQGLIKYGKHNNDQDSNDLNSKETQ